MPHNRAYHFRRDDLFGLDERRDRCPDSLAVDVLRAVEVDGDPVIVAVPAEVADASV